MTADSERLDKMNAQEQNRATFTYDWGFKRLCMLAIIMSCMAWTLPFCVERYGERWDNYRGHDRLSEPLTIAERFIQLNIDVSSWVPLAAGFPNYYRDDNRRISRPLYPAIVAFAARLSMVAQKLSPSAFTAPLSKGRTLAAWLMVNWLVYILSVFGFYRLIYEWGFGVPVAFVSAGQLALCAPNVLWLLPEASDQIAALGIVVGGFWLFSRMLKKEALETKMEALKAIACGVGLGTLMLIKPHYDVLATGWATALYFRRWLSGIVSFASHLVPTAIWLFLVSAMGFIYFHQEFSFGQGAWIINEFIYWSPMKMVVSFASFSQTHFSSFLNEYGYVPLAAAIIGLLVLARNRSYGWMALAMGALIVNLVFCFAIQKGPLIMTIFVIYPLAAIAIGGVMKNYDVKTQKLIAFIYLLILTVPAIIFHVDGPYNYVWPVAFGNM